MKEYLKIIDEIIALVGLHLIPKFVNLYQTNILSRYSDGVVPVCLRKKRVIVEFD